MILFVLSYIVIIYMYNLEIVKKLIY
jgi:hypothetical protein